ncbi:MAG: DMT family transporter [Candidatus Hadarchaeia archaeon]
MNSSLVGPVMALAGAFMLAIELMFIRKATVKGRSFDAVLVSIWVNVAVFLPAFFLFHGFNFEFNTLSVAYFILSSLLGTVLGRIAFYASTKRIGASLTAPISQANLLVATIFGIVVLEEAITGGHLGGIFILLVGVVVVSYEIDRNGGRGAELVPRVELLLPFSTVLLFGLSAPLFKMGLNEGTPLLGGFALKSVSALVGVASYSLAKGFSPLRPFYTDQRRTFAIASVAQTAGFFLIYSALGFADVVAVAPFQNMQPFFVLLMSYFFLGHLEKITKRLAIGAILVVAGAIIIGVFM